MSTTKSSMPLVSVIITTRNEEKNIEGCLISIEKQTYSNIECIVVDNASRDYTKTIARRYKTAVYDKGPERSAQRNYGAKVAKGMYVLFLDADMELDPQVVSQSVEQKSSAVIIPERSVGGGYWTKCKILERKFYEGIEWMEAARFYDKKIFRSLHGFDEHLTGPEDFDLSQRVITKYGISSVSRVRAYIYHHEGRIILADLLRKKWYYGKKMSLYVTKAENTAFSAKQINPFYRYLLFFRRPGMLLSDPVHAAGMILMKTLELVALAGGSVAGRI